MPVIRGYAANYRTGDLINERNAVEFVSNIQKIASKLTPIQVIKEYRNASTFLIKIPPSRKTKPNPLHDLDSRVLKIGALVEQMSSINNGNRTLVIVGQLHILPHVYHFTNKKFLFKKLIAIRLKKPKLAGKILSNEHLGALIMSTRKYKALNEIRKPYQYCKSCKATVKDYGGKGHLLMADGTRISDVWTDVLMDADENIPDTVAERLLRLTSYEDSELVMFTPKASVIDSWKIRPIKDIVTETVPVASERAQQKKAQHNTIFNMDVFDGLKRIPDSAVDLALVDPPYNLRIKYGDLPDNMSNSEYVAWCKRWIDEIARTLRPGGVLTLVNIPVWSLELFPYLQRRLAFHTWIVWDSFSYPYSPIMPAHYPILCFTKGKIKSALTKNRREEKNTDYDLMHPLNYGYCIRRKCINARAPEMNRDRKVLSDLWTDIHRIRHNSFRYDHPTLMPQKLAKRLILTFSEMGDTILDCFNGIGTTSLVSCSLDRKYIGIEKNSSYFKTSLERHDILNNGKNPFARSNGISTSAAKRYRSIKPQVHVRKKALQNEVKKIAISLGHVPSEKELERYGEYPIKYYYDNFADWTEITAAARRTDLVLARYSTHKKI